MLTETVSHKTPDDRGEKIRLIVLELIRRRSAGENVVDEAIVDQHPDLMPELASELSKLRSVRRAMELADEQRERHAMQRLEQDWVADRHSDLRESRKERLRSCDRSLGSDSRLPLPLTEEIKRPMLPDKIGRYRVERLLGQGGFGAVYLARDEELGRLVAVKLPHRQRMRTRNDIDSFLAEARVLASLDHSAVVPVYDAGRTDDGGCFVVSKYLPGESLAERIKLARLELSDALRVVVTVAEALHYAHTQGVVHRDIKPANILLDSHGNPFVVDFGLALKDDDVQRSAQECFAGTPGYMSPEQARGEGHRVDGRSDVFSVGVVMYELLTGQRPFVADSYEQFLERIIWDEVRPLRQMDESIPVELDRICLKCLSKRAVDRYATAGELAADLQSYLATTLPPISAKVGTSDRGAVHASRSVAVAAADQSSRIVPKGLRAFDSNDADFFLDLLPGPRDRHGIPESLRHWKHRIESCDPDDSFPVGVLYGPSGCGKSSFIQAGLLPRLATHVEPLLVEAAPDETEDRLLRRLGNKYPRLAPESGLTAKLSSIRRGDVLPAGRKVLLVIDQFEQWLHSRGDVERRGLVQALRQCDGVRLQCLLLVRDDFWLTLSRFLAELEIDLVQGRNAALVDLFDRTHARRVLAEFGRAFDRLPDNLSRVSEPEAEFLDGAIDGLSDTDKVIPVRLALLAEMVKSRPWTPATLREMGGASGVGVAFLEETFDARSANPRNRQHERAARAVLESLLPEPGSPIKGAMRSYASLLDISGYGHQPREFKELMRILDSETRLLTPTDADRSVSSEESLVAGTRYYQLTHDYLVPSLREWLTKKQRATHKGRAELRLAERAQMWNTRRERRQLPSLWEWLMIRLRTRPNQWTPTQQQMMQSAGRRNLVILGLLLMVMIVFLAVGSDISSLTTDVLVNMRGKSANVWLALGQEEAIWPLLKHSPDPSLRTELIHGINPVVISPTELVTNALAQSDVSIERAMLLAAGENFHQPDERELSSDSIRRDAPARELVQQLTDLYQSDPDAGIHAAAEWALRRLGQHSEINKVDYRLESFANAGERLWYRNAQGHVMVILPGPAQFEMGSPMSAPDRRSDEPLHSHRLARSFSIASKETTVAQFQQFLRDHPETRFTHPQQYQLTLNSPQIAVSWYQAAAYCNWLSEQEGIPREQWCYLPDEQDRYREGMRIAPNAVDLRGYRLPTEAEWEYACRAGATTSWYFGNTAGHLDRFAAIAASSRGDVSAVGIFKPNDFGLFDMLGNAAEWCHETYQVDPRTRVRETNDGQAALVVSDGESRVVRGGSSQDDASRVRCASRNMLGPAAQDITVGFRVSRSYP